MEPFIIPLVILAFFGFLVWRVIQSEKQKPPTKIIPKGTDDNGIPQDVDRIT